MTVYVIADVEVTDEAWIPEYAEKVHDMVHRHGGKYLSRSANIEILEGEPLPTTLIAPFEYTALIWSAILGYLIWNDIPDGYAIAGALLIIGSGIYIIHRESINRAKV